MSESEESKGFKITDRRKFTSTGEPRPPEEVSREPENKAPEAKGQARPSPETSRPRTDPRGPDAPQQPGGAPEPSFMNLVSMLATNALVQLGEMPDPVSGERVEDLQGVQIMIGLLSVLQKKSEGNLSADEAQALDSVLYDLRMRFMQKSNLIKY